MHTVREAAAGDDPPLWVHSGWAERFPKIVQGITVRSAGETEWDFGLAGDAPAGAVLPRWRQLLHRCATPAGVHSLQIHGARVELHTRRPAPAGLLLIEGCDGHLTRTPGLLLAVTVADCVPVFMVSDDGATIGALHAGWRGVAAGILERAAGVLADGGVHPSTLWVHCGPAICGECYEVGPEVHHSVNPALAPPAAPAPIDLRAALAGRARQLGVPEARISVSAWCTRCDSDRFFSHRAGSAGRQLGVIGIRA